MKIVAPPSKSYAQRAIACALLARGSSEIYGVGDSYDVTAAIGIARALGAEVSQVGETLYIKGGLHGSSVINVGESGLATRLFTPIAATVGFDFRVQGTGSILGRRMSSVVDTMARFGVEVKCNGYLPFEVRGKLQGGGRVQIDGSQSSQLITGLITALPVVDKSTTMVVDNLQSKPYIDVTIDVMRAFGVEIENEDYKVFKIEGKQIYQPTKYKVEGDWSGASCMVVAGAIFGGVEVDNLNPNSLQADRAIVDAVAQAGSDLRAIDFDATHCPDLFPALVALAAHCSGVSQIRGTHRLVDKESNRALALQSEFAKLGIKVDISTPDIMKITGGVIKSGAVIDTHNDHRIAMATAVAAIGKDVEFDNPSVVDKSYPNFWEHYSKIALR